MRVALVDYDSGNLHSAEKAFALMGRETGAEVVVTSDPDVVARPGALSARKRQECRAAFAAVEALRQTLAAMLAGMEAGQ